MDALVVSAGTARCALPMDRIAEVRAYTPETPVPGAPAAIRGIVERNGEPVHVLDLTRRLFGAPSRVGDHSCFVFIHDVPGHGPAALLVDDIERMVDGAAPRPADTPPFDCVAGVLDSALPLLDVDKLFDLGAPPSRQMDRRRPAAKGAGDGARPAGEDAGAPKERP